METKDDLFITGRLKSFVYAFKGLARFFRTEYNAWIHALAVVAVTAAGFGFHLNREEWIGVVFAAGLVLAAEAFNTCIEKAMDFLAPQYSEQVGYIKDLAAGGVLVAAITAVIIGGLIFLPKIFP